MRNIYLPVLFELRFDVSTFRLLLEMMTNMHSRPKWCLCKNTKKPLL